jgi:hypothetical protein
MRAALCAVPSMVLLLTHPVWRVVMSEARRKQVGRRLVMLCCVVVVSLQARGATETPLVCGSEIAHHLVHLIGIDGGRIPCHAVASLDEMATDLPIGHTADELLPRGLVIAAILDTRLSGVVEKLIVPNPEGSVPGLVGCPTVVGAEGAGHDLGSFGMCKFYRVSGSVPIADVPGCGLALRGREGERATLSECLTVGGRPCHHGVMLAGVVCHDGGEVRCFVHALSMAADGVLWGKWWTP